MRRAATLLAGSTLMAVTFGTPIDAAMPDYDVAAHCQQVAKMTGNSEEMRRFCLKQEQTAYNVIKPIWDGLPASMRAHCDQVGEMTGQSFEMLKFCVEQETNAAKSNQQFKFQR